MFKILTLLILLTITANASVPAPDGMSERAWRTYATLLGESINRAGYNCEVVDFIVFDWGKSYNVSCNGYRSEFDVYYHGGRWLIRVIK